ncbi:MAG: 3-phenylpropionate dioxygenase [Candidatus Rokuibacteriota bacterium]|nr:MAG: 3-phenylpropionate dioxygenase [Candidatus Rokubacteria bacterium]
MADLDAAWPRNDYSRVRYDLFHDSDVFEREQDRIFRGPVWSVLGLETEIPNPGDFRVTAVGTTPVVFNRDQSGAVHAFVNRCAHRGAELVREPYGNCKDHTCIYHAWCYTLQGDLIGVPFQRGANGRGGMPPDFDLREHGLQKLRVAVWKGVVFGTFTEATEPLPTYLGPLMIEHIGELVDRPVKILGYQRQRVFANWKLYLENVRDGYHASLLHEFNRTFGLSRLTQISGGHMDDRHRHSLLFQYAGSDDDQAARQAYARDRVQRGEYMTLKDTAIVRYVKEHPHGITTRIISVFPNAVFHQIYNCLGLRTIRPIDPGQFEIVFILFGYEDDDEAMTGHRVNQANMVGPSGLISMEDGEALELVQRATAPDRDAYGMYEMGGTGTIRNLDTRVNEVPIRGFWSYYSELMGIEPAGAVR